MSATFWDKRSLSYDEGIQNHDGAFDQTIASTKSLLSPSDIVLDVGCASGEYSLDLAPHVQHIHGIDVSQKMIELADQKALHRQINNIRFCQMDVLDPSLTEQSFSIVIAFNVLHLVDDIPQVLSRLHSLLKPGGLIISQTPCLEQMGFILRGFIGLAQKVGLAPKVLSLSSCRLEQLLSHHQFAIEENKPWDVQHVTQWIIARKS